MPPEYLQNVKCPECDGEMVSRKSQHGIFWGCKSFPRCKGTRDSMGRSKKDKEKENDTHYGNKHPDYSSDDEYTNYRED